MNWNDLQFEQNYEPRKVYNQSKLCNVLFTRALAKRLERTSVTVNALHPGVVRTELGRYFSDSYGWKARLFFVLFYPLTLWMMKTPVQGAQTTIHCAVDRKLDTTTGVYFSDCRPKKLLPHALNEQDAEKLWQISEKLCNLNNN